MFKIFTYPVSLLLSAFNSILLGIRFFLARCMVSYYGPYIEKSIIRIYVY